MTTPWTVRRRGRARALGLALRGSIACASSPPAPRTSSVDLPPASAAPAVLADAAPPAALSAEPAVVSSLSASPAPSDPPIPCKTDNDCWFEFRADRRIHPAARPKNLRGHAFRPCGDGETPPVCGVGGQCVMGHSYKC